MEQIADKQGIYYVINTEVEASETWVVKGLNGTQGDDLRTVNFAIKEGTISGNGQDTLKPKNLAGLAVRFAGKDANGKRKYVDGMYEIVSESGGLVSVTLPKEVYMAHGDYESAFLEIYDPKGKANTATVKLAMTVVQNDVAFTTNPSADYINRVEQIIKECENKFDVATNGMNKRIEEFDTALQIQKKQLNAIQELIDTWNKLIQNNGVPTTGGNVKWFADHEFVKFISGFITGTVVQCFDGNNPQQDLNDVKVLRDMRTGTVQTTYYGGNKVKNNPLSADYLVVTRHKTTDVSVYEQAMFVGQESGVIKARVINDLSGAARFGAWGTVSEWGAKWQSLVPYLSDDFVAHSSTPSFRVIGNKVQFSGAITAKKTITNKNNLSIKLTKEFPFQFIGGQETIKVSGGAATYALFAYGNQLEMQKHQIGGNWADIVAGNYIGISCTVDIQ